jgi:hypothetical protein
VKVSKWGVLSWSGHGVVEPWYGGALGGLRRGLVWERQGGRNIGYRFSQISTENYTMRMILGINFILIIMSYGHASYRIVNPTKILILSD